MKYIDFRNKLKKFIVFNQTDILKYDPDFTFIQLTRWQEKGYIRKVIKGYYIFSDLEIDEIVLIRIVNTIYQPSYISLFSALRYYNLIPEEIANIQSVTTKKTKNFQTKIGEFSYFTIKPELFFGIDIINELKIAEPEKALLDLLYLYPQYSNREDFEGLRLNKETFTETVNIDKLKLYAKAYENKQLYKRLINLLDLMET